MPDLPARLSSIAAKLRTHHREHGTRATARLVGQRLVRAVYKEEPLLVIVKDLADVRVPVRRGRVRLEPLEPRHLPALRELNRDRPEDPGADDRHAADLAAGYAGFVGFIDDEVVACYWWADATMPEHRDMRLFDLGIELGRRDVYGFDLYVRRDRRGGGTGGDVLYQVERALQERGMQQLWGYVLADNAPARWVYDARGYEARWGIDRRRILGRWRNRIVSVEGAERRA